jgi:hypothetical protein
LRTSVFPILRPTKTTDGTDHTVSIWEWQMAAKDRDNLNLPCFLSVLSV